MSKNYVPGTLFKRLLILVTKILWIKKLRFKVTLLANNEEKFKP